MVKLLIDTDPGQDIDDLLAIWFALRRPELEVVAITTVTHPARDRARLVRRLLRHLDREAIPVGSGMELPLRRVGADELARLHDRRWSLNHACFAEPADPRDEPGGTDAIDLIIRSVEAHPGELVLACIAPLTNIACALRRRPDIAPRIKGIAMMGGETALNRAEHNIAFDPVAADIVLSAGIPVAMGTWDVTRRFVLTADECARIGALATPLGPAMAAAIAAWHPAQSWKPGPVMYDLFPMIHAFARGLYELKAMPVQVELHGERTRGMTVVGGDAPQIEVTIGVDVERVRRMYLETLGIG